MFCTFGLISFSWQNYTKWYYKGWINEKLRWTNSLNSIILLFIHAVVPLVWAHRENLYFSVSMYADGATPKNFVKQRVKYFGSLKPTR